MVKLNHDKKVITLNSLNLDKRKKEKILCISIYYLAYLFVQNTNLVQLTSNLKSGYT